MSKYCLVIDFGSDGYEKRDVSIWLVIKTLIVFSFYDNKRPYRLIVSKEIEDL